MFRVYIDVVFPFFLSYELSSIKNLSPKAWKNQMEREYMDTDKRVLRRYHLTRNLVIVHVSNRFCRRMYGSWIPLAKCDSIGDEIGADQDWGKLQENRDRPIPCIRFYRLPFLLPCRGNFYSPSSSSTRFKLDLRSVFRSLRGEYSVLFSILKNSGFRSTLTIY